MVDPLDHPRAAHTSQDAQAHQHCRAQDSEQQQDCDVVSCELGSAELAQSMTTEA
jgi:hypothetical protein